jgi:hypothetical protein
VIKSIRPKRQKSYFEINEKIYKVDLGITDGYGLLRKNPRKNRRFEKILKKIYETPTNYNVEIIKGLKAYDRYGIKKVFGVARITKK